MTLCKHVGGALIHPEDSPGPVGSSVVLSSVRVTILVCAVVTTGRGKRDVGCTLREDVQP